MDLQQVYQIPQLQIAAYTAKMQQMLASRSDRPEATSDMIRLYLNKFNQSVGTPIASWEELEDGDPPFSAKFNQFYNDYSIDSAVISNQLDILKAAIISTHNLVKTELLKASYDNARLKNKLKTLQLYSTSSDNSLFIFRDSFISNEFIDKAKSGSSAGLVLDGSGELTLNIISQTDNPFANASIYIEPTSNGIPGNTAEVELINEDILNNTNEPPAGADKYEFIGAQAGKLRSDTKLMIDGRADTWFEFEQLKISEADKKNTALNFNFKYIDDIWNNSKETITWGNGPTNDKLTLEMTIQLQGNVRTGNSAKASIINSFYLKINEVKNKNNYPVKVKSVYLSPDGKAWNLITPENVWLSYDANVVDVDAGSDISLGMASWTFEPQIVSHVKVVLEQNKSYQTSVGHIYWMTKEKTERVNATDTKPASTRVIPPKRAEGPVPLLSRPFMYYGVNGRPTNLLDQKLEIFSGQRWAIAINEIGAKATTYARTSTIISKKFEIPMTIDRVMLDADILIPSNYDQSQSWVKFYISPNDGVNWYRISRIQDPFNDVPEIIAFNEQIPEEYREPGVSYYDVGGSPNSIRVKIELSRPDQLLYSTPIVKGYTLKVKAKN